MCQKEEFRDQFFSFYFKLFSFLFSLNFCTSAFKNPDLKLQGDDLNSLNEDAFSFAFILICTLWFLKSCYHASFYNFQISRFFGIFKQAKYLCNTLTECFWSNSPIFEFKFLNLGRAWRLHGKEWIQKICRWW